MVYDFSLFGEDDMREYEWEDDVLILDGIAGSIVCPSCEVGENYNHDEPYDYEAGGCVECKNTGRVLVSI